MQHPEIDTKQPTPKKKHRVSIFEYGAIFALVSVTVVISAQLTEHSGFGAMNAMNAVSLNAVSDAVPGTSPFKAD